MKTKTKSITIAAIAVVTGYIISHPVSFNICNNTYQFNNYLGCLDGNVKSIGFPLFYFSLWILLSVVVITFSSEKTFRSWLYFITWAIPLAVLWIALTPIDGSRMGINFFPFYRDDAAKLAGGIFAVASLILIICRALRSARTE